MLIERNRDLSLTVCESNIIFFSSNMKEFVANWSGMDILKLKRYWKTKIAIKKGNEIKLNFKNQKEFLFHNDALCDLIKESYNGCVEFKLIREGDIFILKPKSRLLLNRFIK